MVQIVILNKVTTQKGGFNSAFRNLKSELLHQYRGEEGRQLWKQKQQGSTDDEANQKWIDTAVNHTERHFGNIFHHKDIHCHRWNDNSNHHGNRDDHAKPDGVKPQFDDGRIENRSGKNHESKVVDKRTSHLVDHRDDDHPDVTIQRKG